MVFLLVGIGMILGAAALMAVMAVDTWQWDLVPLGGFLFLMGLLFVLVALQNMNRSYTAFLVFDNRTENLTYHTGDPSRGIVFPYGEIRGFNGYLRYESSSSSSGPSRRVPVFTLFAQKADGSLFWITNPGSRERLREMGERLARFTGHSFDGTAADAGSIPARREYVYRKGALAASLGSWVESSADVQGRSFRLKKRTSASEIVTLFIVCFFMLGLAVGVPIGVGADNPWMLLAMLPVMIVPVGIVALIIFFQLRDYRLVLGRTAIELRLRYRFAPLDRVMGNVVKIPADRLRSVRVSRYEMGYIGLGLGYDASYPINKLSGFLANLLSIRNPLPIGESDTREIAVWQIEPWNPPGKGVTWNDLLAIEREIEEFYGLEKDS